MCAALQLYRNKLNCLNSQLNAGYIEIKKSGWTSFSYLCVIDYDLVQESTGHIEHYDTEIFKVTLKGRHIKQFIYPLNCFKCDTYTNTLTHTHTFTHTHTHTHTHTRTHALIQTRQPLYVHTSMPSMIQTPVRTYRIVTYARQSWGECGVVRT